MADADGVVGLEVGKGVGELAEGAADAVVFGVVGGGCDGVAAADCGGEVVLVGFVGCEVDFSEELGFVIFEFTPGSIRREVNREKGAAYTMIGGGEGKANLKSCGLRHGLCMYFICALN